MVSARNPLRSLSLGPFSVNSASSASKSPHHIFNPPRRFLTTQLLPSFSTRSKQHSHRNARNSFSLYALLHTSPHTRGGGHHDASSALAARSTLLSAGCLTPLNATFTSHPTTTHSKALTLKLNPLDATFTKNPGGPRPFFPHLSPYFVTSLSHYLLPSNSLHYPREYTP
jgi:hypothetical protein